MLRKKPFDPRRWEEIRKKGRTRFILVRGILLMGIPFALIAALMEPVIGRIAWGAAYTPDSAVRMIQWPLAGLFFGLLAGIMLWYGGEREYEKYRETHPVKKKKRRKKKK